MKIELKKNVSSQKTGYLQSKKIFTYFLKYNIYKSIMHYIQNIYLSLFKRKIYIYQLLFLN